MKLDPNDKIVGVEICKEDQDIMLSTKNGKSIRFESKKLRIFKVRSSKGIKGIELGQNDEIVSLSIVNQEKNKKNNKDNLTTKNQEPLIFKTNFDVEIISTLFSNLSALNLIKLNKLKKNYTSLGYSTVKINNHLLIIYTYPIYLSIMVCVASILMLNIGHNKPRVFYLILGILISVTVYYANYLFNILVENQKIYFAFSIWSIQLLLLLLCLVGLVRVNEK